MYSQLLLIQHIRKLSIFIIPFLNSVLNVSNFDDCTCSIEKVGVSFLLSDSLWKRVLGRVVHNTLVLLKQKHHPDLSWGVQLQDFFDSDKVLQ
jgi:hypothetical protein